MSDICRSNELKLLEREISSFLNLLVPVPALKKMTSEPALTDKPEFQALLKEKIGFKIKVSSNFF